MDRLSVSLQFRQRIAAPDQRVRDRRALREWKVAESIDQRRYATRYFYDDAGRYDPVGRQTMTTFPDRSAFRIRGFSGGWCGCADRHRLREDYRHGLAP